MTDEEADRDPEPPSHIKERRKREAKLDRQFRERRRELKEKAAGDPWDFIPETHDDMYNPADYEVSPLWEVLADSADTADQFAEVDDLLADTIGRTRLRPHYWSQGDNANLSQKLSGLEATRIYLYLDLSPLPEYRIVNRLKNPRIRESLSIENTVSQPTLNRMPGQMGSKERTYYASQTETLVRQWQDTRFEDWVREPTPDTIAPDGEGVPPIQTLVRELRSETFKYIRLKRDASTEVSKDAAMRVLVTAANGNEFVNDAAKNLELKPWYDGSEIPRGQTLLHHIRKSTREQITQMFGDQRAVV